MSAPLRQSCGIARHSDPSSFLLQSLKECGPTSKSATPETIPGSPGCVGPVRGRKRLIGGSGEERLTLKLRDLQCQGISLDVPRDCARGTARGVAGVQSHRAIDLIATLRQTRGDDDHWRIGGR